MSRLRRNTLHEPGKIYVVEFSGGLIKVGFTRAWEKRLASHRTAAKGFGREVLRTWASERHWEAAVNERELIRQCARLAGSQGPGEYFALPFDSAVAIAETLPRNQISAEQLAIHEANSEINARALGRLLGYGEREDALAPGDLTDEAPPPGACPQCDPSAQDLEGDMRYSASIRGDFGPARVDVFGDSDGGCGYVRVSVVMPEEDVPSVPSDAFPGQIAEVHLTTAAASRLAAALLLAACASQDRGGLAGNHNH